MLEKFGVGEVLWCELVEEGYDVFVDEQLEEYV